MKKYLAILTAFLLVFAFMPTVFASDDTTPPALGKVSINGTDFNVGDTITVTIQASDLESGIDLTKCAISCLCLDGFAKWFAIQNLTPIDGGLQGSYTIGDQFVGGNYQVDTVVLADQRGNKQCYMSSNGDFDKLPFTVHSSYVPPKGPDLTGFSLSKTTAKVGDTITYTLTTADPSGVTSAGFALRTTSTASSWYYMMHKFPVQLSPAPGQAGVFTGTFKITADLPNAEYYPTDIIITGGSGVSTHYVSLDSCPQRFDNILLKVSNPKVPLPLDRNGPKLLSYTMSPHQVIPGQKLTITATIDPSFVPVDHLKAVIIRKTVFVNSGSAACDMTSQGNNVYTGTLTIPLNLEPATYFLSSFGAYLKNGDGGGLECSSWLVYDGQQDLKYLRGGIVNVTTILTVAGTGNTSIPIGGTFDPMAGVTANNAFTGDITGKIQVVGGNIDTSVPGVSLVKYVINDSVSVDGQTMPITYTDYRWIGVTEFTPGDNQGELVVTNDSIHIDTNQNDVTLTLNGKAIPYTDQVSDAGTYTAAVKDVSTVGLKTAAIETGGAQAKMVIDRTGPAFNPVCNRLNSKTMCVNPNASDPSGIAEVKWLAGKITMDTVKTSGAPCNGTFNIKRFGTFSVYARDTQGYESFTTFTVKNIPLKKMSLNLTGCYWSVGMTTRLIASLNPTNATDQRITWSSSNRKIATVDSTGLVRVLKKGKVTITVRSATGKKATCKITAS